MTKPRKAISALHRSSAFEKKAIKDAVTVQIIANKFAQEKISGEENRKQFLDKIRDRIAENIADNNIADNKENKVPKMITNNQNRDEEQER